MKEVGILVIALFATYNHIQKKKEPNIYYTKTIVGGYNGITIPPFGIFINEDQRGNEMLIEHEKVHFRQYQREGLVPFLANYFSEHVKKGYDNNPYEIEARLLSREKSECLHNYTDCIKNGQALTASNPNFRNS